jgi:hypothetical protein
MTAKEAMNLLARMLKSWHIRLKRDSERHSTSGQIMVWVGVQNVHRYLLGETTSEANEDEEITMTQPVGMRDAAQTTMNKKLVALRSNQSRSGVALRIPRQAAPKELIGQLLLISNHETKQGSDWKLGVVKRAMNCGEKLLEVGIQFVTGKLEPITLRLAKQQTEDEVNPDHGGIFIDQGHNNRSSLIVPKHFFVIGQEYRVEEMIPSPSISPLQQLETTAHFERYRIKSV